MSEEVIKIVQVDDHGLCRQALSDLLEARGGMKVLATIGDPEGEPDSLGILVETWEVHRGIFRCSHHPRLRSSHPRPAADR